jgi:1L-myo-inositol 1-phosphate cytidylyltransferase / CDP-L-myo-inositol myo-inositolphosphotransferase
MQRTGGTASGSPATGLLVIIPSKSDTGAGALPGMTIAGVPLLRRLVLAAMRASIGRILVLTPDAFEVRRLLDGTRAMVLTPDGPFPPLTPGRIVLLSMNVLPQPKWLRALFEMSIEPERLYVEAFEVAVIEGADCDAILSAVSHGDGAPELFAALERVFKTDRLPLRDGGKYVIATPEDVSKAEDWVLRGLVKETESFMSRHVERRISLAITRRLASTRITPNAMTLVSLAVGLMGAPFFLSSRPGWQLTGALLFWAHSVLDGCDGELARLKFLESRWGGLLDFWGDNAVHVAVFMCMAIGWSRASLALGPLLVGGVAVAGTVLIASVVYRRTMQEKATDAPLFTSVVRTRASRLSRLADTLARRDFIYLVVLLSGVGKTTWFLMLTAVGSPIFLLVLLWIAHTEVHSEGNLP